MARDLEPIADPLLRPRGPRYRLIVRLASPDDYAAVRSAVSSLICMRFADVPITHDKFRENRMYCAPYRQWLIQCFISHSARTLLFVSVHMHNPPNSPYAVELDDEAKAYIQALITDMQETVIRVVGVDALFCGEDKTLIRSLSA